MEHHLGRSHQAGDTGILGPAKTMSKIRPGRWILRACESCGEMLNARQMVKHKPRCPVKPSSRKMLPDAERDRAYQSPPPTLDMVAKKAEAIARAQRMGKICNLRYFHGITIDDYDRIHAEQAGVCAICKRPPDGTNRRTKTLHVDHDHTTGTIRGLLCQQCNMGLGAFRDDVTLLDSARDYLLGWRFQEISRR